MPKLKVLNLLIRREIFVWFGNPIDMLIILTIARSWFLKNIGFSVGRFLLSILFQALGIRKKVCLLLELLLNLLKRWFFKLAMRFNRKLFFKMIFTIIRWIFGILTAYCWVLKICLPKATIVVWGFSKRIHFASSVRRLRSIIKCFFQSCFNIPKLIDLTTSSILWNTTRVWIWSKSAFILSQRIKSLWSPTP